jgi:broad specificity phosphatase PhoE
MTVTILLVRHASHIDLDRRLSGRTPDVALSEVGRSQAVRLGTAFASEGIQRVECSPLTRASETATAIATACALSEPTTVQALTEIDMGRWTGATFDSLNDDPDWAAWNTHRGSARIPGGETMGEAQARIVTHMHAAAAAGPEGAVIAMVTHCDMIRGAVAHVLGLPLDNLLRFDIGPASVTRIAIGDWGARLMSLNERVG